MSQNYVVNYSFNLGDYVETKEGKKGYIKTIVNTEYPEFQNINIDFGEKGMNIYSFYIYSDAERLSRSFNRIGVYDFTKKAECKNKGKIKPLACETTSDYSNEKLRKKINELVEAVNELKTDYEKHLRAHELTER